MSKPMFEMFVQANRTLDLRSSEFVHAKKMLSAEMLEHAIRDGIALRSQDKQDDFDSRTYAATVRLSRRSIKIADAINTLDVLISALSSVGCLQLQARLINAQATDVDAIKDEVVRYIKLVQGSCADVHCYRNALDNHFARKVFSDEQLACARRMCAELGLTVDEEPARKIVGR